MDHPLGNRAWEHSPCFHTSIGKLQGMIDALLQLSTLVVGQVARDAATQHLLSGTAQTGFKLAQHRAGGNQNEPIAPLPGYPLVEVIRKLSGKAGALFGLSLIHISEPTRLGMISYAVFCL